MKHTNLNNHFEGSMSMSKARSYRFRPLKELNVIDDFLFAELCQDTPEGRRLSLRLMPRESTLLFTCRDEEAFQALPPPREEGMELKADFSLIREEPDCIRKIYAAVVRGEGRDAALHFQAEEMAELEVGGQFVDAAFWSPQVFSIPGSMLPKGREVQLLLTVTGSPANRYGHPVPYGLELQEQ